MPRILENLLHAVLVLGCVSAPVARAQDRPPGAVIFEDVRVFDGITDRLSAPSNVLSERVTSTLAPVGSAWCRTSRLPTSP